MPHPEASPQPMPTLESTIQDLSNRLAQLEVENQALRQAQVQLPSSPPSEPKISFPEKFSGDTTSFRGFLNQLELIFRLQPNRYANDAVKVATVGTLLTEKALAWYNPYLEHAERYAEILNSWSQFKQLFTATFGDIDQALRSANSIRKLTQGRRPAAADFRLLAADLEWNDAALQSQYRSGLAIQVHDLLLHYEEPSSLDELITLSIRIDNRLFEHRQERRGILAQPHARFADDTSTPMDIDEVSTNRRLSAAERQRRIDQRLCIVCAANDHFKSNCPIARNQHPNARG
jgi:hypothetical protein